MERVAASARALSPDTPPAELAVLAARYPARVLANPATPLLVLEDPASPVAGVARRVLGVRRLRARCPGLPAWIAKDGSGYGDGDGYGDGYSYGDGYGDGSGDGDPKSAGLVAEEGVGP